MGDQRTGTANQLCPPRCRGIEDLYIREVQTIQQRAILGIGHDDLAFGAPDVRGQRLAAPGGVQAAEHIATQPGRGHLGQHFGRVAQQGPDM